ncbi:hypothetical protein [Corynebacterium pacaense]|uniref:hypothetical protein n=1 Tax=Corynebacterium pacaense TaxID=1816684 RepID=UPI0009B97024|nr:hypothetical protein [Corynebacterium pacaense]
MESKNSIGSSASPPPSGVSHLVSASLELGDRNRGDGCPGALRMHEADDGLIGRIRMPGGHLDPSDWLAMADLADGFGDGRIHLTSRGNLQIRGISDQSGFVASMSEAGYLPSPAHDLVRNIIASPLEPRLRTLVDRLDAELIASPVAAGLAGRTLFGLDAGGGEIIAENPDFGLLARDGVFELFLAARPVGLSVAGDDAAAVLVRAADIWQAGRGSAWRVKERPEIIPGISESLLADGRVRRIEALPALRPRAIAPIGWIETEEGISLGAGLRLGVLSSRLARFLAAVDAPTTVTPWNSLVITGLSECVAEEVVKVLAPMGLIFDERSPWLRATACTGLPGCGKSHSDVRADLEIALGQGQLDGQGHVHFVGCARRCGHPNFPHTEYQATAESSYDIHQR